MADTCWEDRENAPRKEATWRDLDHHGFDPKWGAISRYQVYLRPASRGPERLIATGKTWEEANIIRDGLNERVRRVKGIYYTSWACRLYGVRLEYPASYPEFCAARRLRERAG